MQKELFSVSRSLIRILMKLNLSLVFVMFRPLIRFIDIAGSIFMTLFLHCFRSAADDHSTTSHSSSDQNLQNHSSPLFMSQAASSPCLDKEKFDLDSIHIENSLKDEARFLKGCGTIPETPIEIRKASQRITSPQHSGSSHFHSWLSSNSAIRLRLDEEVGRTSFTTEVESIGRTVLTAGKTKSVRFDCDLDQSSANSSSSKRETGGRISLTLSSPNPTPLKLSDEMQTPGTIYPSNMESVEGKVRPMIRSQFVYSVSNLLENEETEISQRLWDENGIPNSTTKYEEDQKVSSHATPFQTRLEKALSVRNYK